MNAAMPKILELARAQEQVMPLAVALCHTLQRLDPEVPEGLLYAVLVLCHKIASSDVCIRLSHESFESVVEQWQSEQEDDALCSYVHERFADFDRLKAEIAGCSTLVGQDEQSEKPLILWQERLYLRRYFIYERRVAKFILKREQEVDRLSEEQEAEIARACELLFVKEPDGTPNFQHLAALTALRSRFAVITGGPGTGKTTTVIKLLLLLLGLHHQKLEIKLCAPTGKAAENMIKAISTSRASQDFVGSVQKLEQIFGHALDLDAIPKSAQTLHSLLRVVPHQSRALVNAQRPLNCDVLVVDEFSMVDLPLFAKLCDGLSPRTRLILLGDKDQLFSVESGSLLSDLTSVKRRPSADTLAYLARLSGYKASELSNYRLSDTTVFLTVSHRFKQDSGIGQLALKVNQTELSGREKDELIQSCFTQGFSDLRLSQLSEELSTSALWQYSDTLAQESFGDPEDYHNLCSYKAFLDSLQASLAAGLSLEEAQALFDSLNAYRVLCSNRKGPLGQDELNLRMLLEVRQRFKITGRPQWFPGRVVMVTKNNPGLQLSNGDVGYTAYLKGSKERELMVFFKGSGTQARAIRPIFLNDYEDGYAMTVHKSQGSEYDEVLLVLSDYDNPVLTKELVYTGITRARRRLRLCAKASILSKACSRSVRRESGLVQWLTLQQA
ncbi:MAG: exodeoxyribonuclease V subunit alpha [Succinivibrio sp.]|nr:exodeoxyribonuclease V subunit alpha [Succinivibrio sp.]